MSLTRVIGVILLVAIFFASGYHKITSPKSNADMLKNSNFPQLFSQLLGLAGLKYRLSGDDYQLLIQATGGIFVSFASFIVLGVGRRFFSFLLAVGVAIITVCFHVDLKNPAATPADQQAHVLKNLAIIGGLLILAGSGRQTVVQRSVSKTKRE